MAKNGIVKAALAKSCVENYYKIFQNTSDPVIAGAFTSDVVFDKAELMTWLSSIDADSVKIAFGVYTEEFAAEYPKAKPNRLTTFIYPHKSATAAVMGEGDPDDDDSDAFNLGDFNP